MKKFTGMLSLVVLLLSQGLTPFTYVYADSEEDCSPQESWNGESCVNKCSPRQSWDGESCVDRCLLQESWDGESCIDHGCTETEFYNGEECKDFSYYQCDYNQSRNGESCVDRCSPWQSWDGKTCKNQCASHQKVGYSTYYYSYICEDKCSPDAKLTKNGCVCPTGESRNQEKFACIPSCNDLQDSIGNTCVNKPTYRISFNLLGGSKDSLDIPQNTPVRSLIQKEISVDSHDLTDFRYSKYVTINHATKLDMWIKWFKNYSGDPESDPILFNIGTGSETVNLTEKDPVTEQFIYPNPINTGRDNNSVTFYGYGYGFHAIVTGNVLDVDGIPEGKSFDGWYTDSHFNNKLDIDEEVTDDLTLYGRIVAKVSFDTRGGNIIPDIFVSEGETLENKVTNPQRAYSDFVEWYDNPNFSGEPFNLSSEINSNITLYAKYNCKDDGLQHVLSPLYGYNEGINECFGYNTLNLGAFTLMDRNLGASNNGNWNSSSDRSAGYFYQWGNNYGFPAVFNTLGTGVLIGNGENSYTNSLYGYGWKKPEDASSDDYRYKSLWSELDPQGPCPSGWHVATDSEWRGIVDYLIKEKNYNYEKYYGSKIVTNNELANYLLFPKSNYIKSPINSGSLPELQSDSLGAAWANVYGYGFKIKPEDSATISINFDFPFYNDEFDFMPVRCFKDKTYITFKDVSDEDAWVPSPDIYGTLGFDGSTYTISEISNLPSEIYKLRNYVTFNFTGSDGSYLENQGIANLLSNEFKKSDGNAFVYVNYPRYKLTLHPERKSGGKESYEVLYLNENDSFLTFTLPDIQKEGYEFMGWYTDKDVRLGKSYSGEVRENLAEDGGEVDLYPHFKKTITITVKSNGNKIWDGEARTEDDIVKEVPVYNEGKYTYELPEINAEGTSKQAIGYSTGENDHENIVNNTVELDSDTTFYAQTRNVVKLTIHGNGNTINGKGSLIQVKTGYNADDELGFVLPNIDANDNTPHVIGYTDVSGDLDVADYSEGETLTLSSDKDIYAQTKRVYEKKQAVFLKSQGIASIGDGSQSTITGACTPDPTYNSVVKDSCVVTTPIITSSDGYKEGKWNNEYDGNVDVSISQPVTYFIAGTESNVYSVYYYLNGGEAGENAPSTYNGGTPLTVPNPSKIGYTFSGWTDQEGNFLSSGLSINNSVGNYILSAIWIPNIYTITFAGIDNTVTYEDNNEPYPAYITGTYEDVFTLDTPSKPGYTFSGWQLEDGSIKKVVTISKTTSSRTLTGVWGSGVYNIVYNLNGGENDERNPESYTYSSTEDVEIYSGTRDGYRFDGRYTNRNFDGNPVAKISKGLHDHVVLHAKWTPIIYTITFNNVDGAKLENSDTIYPSEITGAYDDVITLSTPSKEGYEFDGWSVGNSSTISKTVTLSKLTENKTVTAHWTAKRYTITYYPNGGTNNVNNPESYTYSSTSSIPLNDAERVGYHFDGWYTEAVNGVKYTSIPEGAHVNYVFYAHWTANTNTPYKVYHYQESLDGGYLLKDTDSLQGTSDVQVTPAVKSYDGFTAPSTQTGTIRPDGETRVEYKYNRISYSITVNYDGGKDVNNQTGVTYTKKYGDTIEELIPTRAGYSFNGWNQTYPKIMPVVDGTKTIKATWTPTDYTITYNNVEYADNSGAIYGYNATTQPITLNDAYWTGYIFDGWFTQAVGGTQVTAITANDHENKVLYAHWTPKTNIKYTVIHRRQGLDQYYNDDSLKEEVEYTNGVTAKTIEAEQKNYPGFIPPEVKEITIKGDGTSVVEYRYQRMRFTYESEGAVGVDIRGTTANNQYMFYDYPLTLRASVVTGYTWSHWSVNTGDGEYRTFTGAQNTTIGLPAYDSIVKPVVIHNEYTLSFNTFGGVATGGSSIADQTHYYDDEITLPVVVKTGYIFQGWYTEANGQGTRYEADTRMPNNSIELKAYWIPGEVNVKVEYYLQNVDGSTYPEQPSDVLELHKLTESIYTGELKTYEGFTTPAEKSVEVLPDGTSVIRYDYARNSYTLDLNTLTGFAYVSVISTNHPEGAIIDESGAVQSANYYYGEMITVTGELLTGYGMDKWNGADIIGTNSNTPTLTFTMPAQSVELTPNVTKNKYRVTYKDGDRVLAIYDVEYEDVIPTPTAPSKYGYKFTGWNPYPVSGTMPAKALELQAMWESVPISGGSGGGGGGSSINKDDTKKTGTEKEHNSAELTGATQEIEDKKDDEVKQEVKEETKQEETVAPINTESNQPVQPVSVDKEVLTAYEWAYKHDVTTMPTLNDANPEGVVTRGHLAKMVVNYATNVLGYQIPEKIPSECRWNDGRKDWESQEIKDYAVKSCALGLMGLDMPKFLPNMTVTRAQFGTIMSRLLWGKKYAGGKPYYRKHLNALKENNIMTQIENPEKRTELRQWVWLMLMRAAENK